MVRRSTGAMELVLTHSDSAPVRLVALSAPGALSRRGRRSRWSRRSPPETAARTGPRLTDTGVGRRLRYVSHEVDDDDDGRPGRVVLRPGAAGPSARVHEVRTR